MDGDNTQATIWDLPPEEFRKAWPDHVARCIDPYRDEAVRRAEATCPEYEAALAAWNAPASRVPR